MHKKNIFKNIILKYILYSIILFILPSCGYQKLTRSQVINNIHDSIFIPMPKNALVFDNISSVFYQALFLAYKRLGYELETEPGDSFVLKTKINSLEPVEKFISQDLLLYNVRIGVVISCRLFDKNNRFIAEKVFESSRLVSYSIDPIHNSKFLEFEYKRLMDRISIKIERYFRGYLLSPNSP